MGCVSLCSSVIKSDSFHSSFVHAMVIVNLLLLWCNLSYGEVGLTDSDKSALLQFKNSVSDPAGLLSSWNSSDPDYCAWSGVLCNSVSRVVSLNVTGNGEGGKSNAFSCYDSARFPLYWFGIRRKCEGVSGHLIGSLPVAIGELTELRILSLPFNRFDGEIPSEIWNMNKLEVLDLEGNMIGATLPFQFCGLKNLRVLNLGFNRLSGEIPSSLASLYNLEILSLAGNSLNGSVPKFVSKLREVYLLFNLLSGVIPSEIGQNCGKLEHLDLSGNFLTGGIPSSLGNCRRLRSLLLYENMLKEAIPAELGNLQNLQVLDVSRNSLRGAIPKELGNCSELSVLVLSNLVNALPVASDDRRDSSREQLDSVDDENNHFDGGIPIEISVLPKLRILWAPRATLQHSFPSSWGACESLEMINLSQNHFTGEFPIELKQCGKLDFLDISSNNLTGELHEEFPVPCLTVFDVSGNSFSGSIPHFADNFCPLLPSWRSDIFENDNPYPLYKSFLVSSFQLGTVSHLLGNATGHSVFHNFGHNNFTGIIPSLPIAQDRLGEQTVYTFLVGENKLTGSFPGTLFENCDRLDGLILNVSNNRLFGEIPVGFDLICRSLKYLDLSGNLLNGSIPSDLGELVSLVGLNFSRNHLQGQIPSSLGHLKNLKFLSLADNNLTGAIPTDLSQLYSLQVLDLSSNSLVGKIPKDLINLRGLRELLLNNNNLTEEIPAALVNVTKLSSFDVPFNDLSGSAPLNGNKVNCRSAMGNPHVQPCHVFSLTASPSDPQVNTGALNSHGSTPPEATSNQHGNGFNTIEIASITSASAIVAVLLALIVLFFYTRKWNTRARVGGSTRKEVTVFTDIGVPLNYESIVLATGNFNTSNCIGSGGFGATYKAEISPGVLVAIKRLAVGRFQGVQQFHAEIKTLGRLRHPNLVTLIGYHASETEMFLIYNYLPGSNLEKFIHERSNRPVDWKILHKIALDVARALAYLHDQCIPRVLHRDVKPSNILLDDDYNAYLSDFGLARLLGTSETHATTGVAGTFGYVAPEYAMTCRVSDKADVYSYGVVLLELLSDKEALDPSFCSYENGFNIVAWACMLLKQGKAREFFTRGLWDAAPQDHLVEVLHLGVVCTVESLSTRPTMRQVLRRLKQLQPQSC